MSILDNSNLENNTKLYKYMDLEKFLSLIVKGELCFCNQQTLKGIDPYEGAMTKDELIRKSIMDEMIMLVNSVSRFEYMQVTNGTHTLKIDLKKSDNFTFYNDKSYYIDCCILTTMNLLQCGKCFLIIKIALQ